MSKFFEYPKEIPGSEYPPYIVGRADFHRAAHLRLDIEVPEQWHRLVLCCREGEAWKIIFKQIIYKGETSPRSWQNFGSVPPSWTILEVVTMMQVETKEWTLREKPWKTEPKPEEPVKPDPERLRKPIVIDEKPEAMQVETDDALMRHRAMSEAIGPPEDLSDQEIEELNAAAKAEPPADEAPMPEEPPPARGKGSRTATEVEAVREQAVKNLAKGKTIKPPPPKPATKKPAKKEEPW